MPVRRPRRAARRVRGARAWRRPTAGHRHPPPPERPRRLPEPVAGPRSPSSRPTRQRRGRGRSTSHSSGEPPGGRVKRERHGRGWGGGRRRGLGLVRRRRSRPAWPGREGERAGGSAGVPTGRRAGLAGSRALRRPRHAPQSAPDRRAPAALLRHDSQGSAVDWLGALTDPAARMPVADGLLWSDAHGALTASRLGPR